MAEDIINNRKVLREYHILERFEAGIALKGTEIKSIRAGHANLNDAFARVDNGQAFLLNADIQPYERASHDTSTSQSGPGVCSSTKPKSLSSTGLHPSRDMRWSRCACIGKTVS